MPRQADVTPSSIRTSAAVTTDPVAEVVSDATERPSRRRRRQREDDFGDFSDLRDPDEPAPRRSR